MNYFFSVAKREIKLLSKKPTILFIMFVVPLVLCFLLASIFITGSATDLPIAVLDQDNSSLTRKFVRMIDATPSCAVKFKVNDLEEGRKLIAGGQAYALIYIPRNFTKDLFRSTHPQLVYYYNNQSILIGGVITKDITTTVMTVMGGADALVQMKKGLPKDAVLKKINLIRVDERIKSNPYMNYSYFLSFVSFIHTFQIIITFLAIWTIGVEFKSGTTKEWLSCANNSIFIAVFGKLIIYIISFLALIAITYSSYIIFYEAPFNGNIPFLTLGTLCYILAYQLTGVAFVAIFSNLRYALSTGAFYTSLGFTFAGMTFPCIGMPSFAKFYSSLLPIRPYVALAVDQIMRGFPPVYDFGYVFWLLGLASVGIFTLPLLKKHAYDEKMWYKI